MRSSPACLRTAAKIKKDFTMGKTTGKAMGIRKDTRNRPQGAQRCLKMAANRVGSVYRSAADYPTCTELNKTSSILFNLMYPHVSGRRFPLGIVSAFSGAVKVIKSSTTCFHYTFFLYSYIAVKSKGRLTPSFALAHFFFRGFGSGVAASASCSTCSVSSRFSTFSM